jgi:protoporphyrinogen/coproporphyrinogen III oxidase
VKEVATSHLHCYSQVAMKRVVVAGAGISGLALAFELRRLGVPVLVLESDGRAGGKIESDHRDGYLCERGPASFLDRSGSIGALARALGIEERVLRAGDAAERRLVAADGRLVDTPRTAVEFARSALLPWCAKLRVSLDLLLARGPSARGEDESVAAFARRRLGAKAGERLLQPLVSGLYAGDPEQVSLPSAFPLVAAMERDRRSFLLAMRRELAASRSKSAPRLASFTNGLDELTSALAAALGADLRLRARVVRVERAATGFRVAVEDQGGTETVEADVVVLAIPAHVACGVTAAVDGKIADALARIAYVPVTLVHLGYPSSAFPHPLDAYGFFVPPSEPMRVLGGIFPSQFFLDRAPSGFHLLSIRTGGARHPEAFSMPDQDLLRLADGEIRPLVGLAAPPSFVHIVRHERALPQYTIGHMERLAVVEEGEKRHPGLFFHGNAYHNAGVPELVLRSTRLAERVARLARNQASAD